MKLEAYLFFPGNAEEAMTFYRDVFGGDLVVTRPAMSILRPRRVRSISSSTLHSTPERSCCEQVTGPTRRSTRRPGSS